VQQFEGEMDNIEGLQIEKVHYGGEDMWKEGLYRAIGQLFGLGKYYWKTQAIDGLP
jgi:hypothetical protein